MTAEFIVAVHSVVFLNHRKKFLCSEEIAENVCTNPARVRKVLAMLKRAGIVEVRGGSAGGYGFTGNPNEVTLLDIFQATGESFVKVSWRSGDAEMECPIARNMAPIMDTILDGLDECCKRHLRELTIGDIDRRIFPKEEQTGTEP